MFYEDMKVGGSGPGVTGSAKVRTTNEHLTTEKALLSVLDYDKQYLKQNKGNLCFIFICLQEDTPGMVDGIRMLEKQRGCINRSVMT